MRDWFRLGRPTTFDCRELELHWVCFLLWYTPMIFPLVRQSKFLHDSIQNYWQKLLMSGLLKLAKSRLAVPKASDTNMWLSSGMKRIKNGNSTTENRLNHCMIFHAYCKKNRPAEPGRSFFFFNMSNLHFLEQKIYSQQVPIYLNAPGIPVRKPLQNRKIDSWRTTGCVSFRGDLCKLVDWETFINEQKG